jgi:dolichol kinase
MYDIRMPDLSYWEIASGSVFFQFSLYIAVRLAHRGFTLGELGLVVFGATALFIELVNLTIARVRIGSECVFTY